MEDAPWWPSGLLERTAEHATSDLVRTPWGLLTHWDIETAMNEVWWEDLFDGAQTWGEWPQNVASVSLQHESRAGRWVNLDTRYTALLLPFATGQDLSMLARYTPWCEALEPCDLLLPIGGMFAKGGDYVVLFPFHEPLGVEALEGHQRTLAQGLTKVHAALDFDATPNTERRWNDRLKAMEDELQTKTLWRAPHTDQTVGLPPVHVSLEAITRNDERLLFVPQPRSVADYLLCEEDRLPSLAGIMHLEQAWAKHTPLSEDQRQAWLATWEEHAPKRWSSGRALSTALGGAWVWRYHANILQLANATLYGDSTEEERCMSWLSDVSRLQARLGNLRFLKSGLWVGVIGVVVAWFGTQWSTFSSGGGIAIAASSVAFAWLSNRLYWRMDPPPY